MQGSQLNLTFGGYSSAGVKDENQDAFAAMQPTGNRLQSKGAVACIADGVSACSRAKEAATTCASQLVEGYLQTPETWTVKTSIAKVINGLNQWCHGQHDYEHAGHSQMLTTLSSIIFKSTTGFIFHVGDSRIYRLQNSNVEQLTKDHCVVQGKNPVLTRAIGIESHVDVDFQSIELTAGDIFLLSTDGLHDFIEEQDLQTAINHGADLETAAEQLISQALINGSDDNLTCLLVRVESLPEPDLNEYHRQLMRLAMPPTLEVGMKLDGKRVLQVIFNGTRSALYKVVDESNNKIYGLKAPSQHFADDPIYLEGFLREEWIGQRIDHANIMKVYTRPENSKFLYHLCEFIEGQTLRQWMLDNPKPNIEQVRQIIEPLALALRVLQRKDMVHRDVKPENVMINHLGEVKLIDFGTVLVKSLAETNQVLADDIPLGSVNYIAPEYLLTNEADQRSDLFSVAVVCYEMLTGELPFKPFAFKEYRPKDLSEWKYIPLQQCRPDLPIWLDLTIQRALAPSKTNRYQAFSEWLTDLQKPNISMLKEHKQKPLLERNPILFWKISTVIFFIIALIEFMFLTKQ